MQKLLGLFWRHLMRLLRSRFAAPVHLMSKKRSSCPCHAFIAGTLEEPLRISMTPAAFGLNWNIWKLQPLKFCLSLNIVLENQGDCIAKKSLLFECAKPGMIYENVYYRFQPQYQSASICAICLRSANMTIPEPLFGTFVENSLSELMRFADSFQQGDHRALCDFAFCGAGGG